MSFCLYFKISLVKDGVTQTSLRIADTTNFDGCTSSRTVVINCLQGELLWLKSIAGTGFWGDDYYGYPTTFAGFLLTPG